MPRKSKKLSPAQSTAIDAAIVAGAIVPVEPCKPAPKPAPKPAFIGIHTDYSGASTADTKRTASVFATAGRVFSNFTHRSDTYLHALHAAHKTAEFSGSNRDKAVVEIAIYAGLLSQTNTGKLQFTKRGLAYAAAPLTCPDIGQSIPHDSFFQHLARCEKPAPKPAS